MKGRDVHYSTEQFNLLLDNQLGETEAQPIQDHLNECIDCRLAFDNLKRIDGAVRNIPVLETHSGFTRSVMEGILSKGGSSFAFRMFERLSYVFGLLIVLGIMITSFILTGVFDTTHVDETRSVATGIASQFGNDLASSVNGFTAWLIQYLPFAFGKGSVGVAFFAAVVLLMLAAVDRLVGKRWGRQIDPR